MSSANFSTRLDTVSTCSMAPCQWYGIDLVNRLTHRREGVEVAGYISHDTALVRTRDVAQIRYFEQLLYVVSRKHSMIVYSRNALVYQDDPQQLGRRVGCYHVDQTATQSGTGQQGFEYD